MHTIPLVKQNNQIISNGFPFETYVQWFLSMIWPNPIWCNIHSQFDIITPHFICFH